MSAADVLRAAVAQQLAALRVFDAPPARAALPYAVVGEPQLEAVDAAGLSGRAGSVAIIALDEGERPERLRQLLGGVEAALAAMPADLGAGWRLATLRLQRSRIVAGRGGRWTGTSDFAVRLYRINS